MNPHLLNDENECRIFPLDWSKEIRNFDRYYDIVLAAECCYDRDTSKNLFSLINWLFREEKIKMAIFTLEERPNFMLDSMSVRSTERDRNGSKKFSSSQVLDQFEPKKVFTPFKFYSSESSSYC